MPVLFPDTILDASQGIHDQEDFITFFPGNFLHIFMESAQINTNRNLQGILLLFFFCIPITYLQKRKL